MMEFIAAGVQDEPDRKQEVLLPILFSPSRATLPERGIFDRAKIPEISNAELGKARSVRPDCSWLTTVGSESARWP